jgi:hypothetical protein
MWSKANPLAAIAPILSCLVATVAHLQPQPQRQRHPKAGVRSICPLQCHRAPPRLPQPPADPWTNQLHLEHHRALGHLIDRSSSRLCHFIGLPPSSLTRRSVPPRTAASGEHLPSLSPQLGSPCLHAALAPLWCANVLPHCYLHPCHLEKEKKTRVNNH